MACGAPTSRSSGGRSAVHTSSGTPARSASTIAGCSSAAAVPLVVSTSAGRPVADAHAERQERARALVVVDVRPGAGRRRLRPPGRAPAGSSASRGTPPRAAARRAPTRRRGWTRTWPARRRVERRRRGSRRDRCAVSSWQRQEFPAVVLHGERDGSGPRVVLLHGFGQTGRCWGPLAGELARDHEVVRLDAPGHAGSGDVAADLPTTGRLAAAAGGPGVYLGYSMGARMALHVATEASRGRPGARAGGRHTRDRRRRRAGRPPRRRPGPRRPHPLGRGARVRGPLAGPADVRGPAARGRASSTSGGATPPRGSPPASSSPAPVRRRRCGQPCPASTCRCS